MGLVQQRSELYKKKRSKSGAGRGRSGGRRRRGSDEDEVGVGIVGLIIGFVNDVFVLDIKGYH